VQEQILLLKGRDACVVRYILLLCVRVCCCLLFCAP
jgi:hypothetical protein